MSNVRLDVDGAVGTITLDRPEKLNAFFGTMREDLLTLFRQAEGDAAVRVVVVTGAGRAFCAGGDVEFMRGLAKAGDEAGMKALLEAGKRVVLAVARMAKPVVAKINGVAAGAGLNLALACDLRVASDQAKFGETFAKLGLHPDWGGSSTLPTLVGPGWAAEMVLLAEMMDAATAERIGLVTRVVPHERLDEEVRKIAEKLAKGPPLALGLAKRSIRRELEAALDVEIAAQLQCFRSADFAEGLAAFFEKREPRFRGQ